MIVVYHAKLTNFVGNDATWKCIARDAFMDAKADQLACNTSIWIVPGTERELGA